MGDSIINSLQSALSLWNEKLSELFSMLTTTPEEFRGGAIWAIILKVFDSMSAVGLALVTLCWFAGVIKTVGTFTELKRPEVAVKVIVRLILAQYVVTNALELMKQFISLACGIVANIMTASGFLAEDGLVLPEEIIRAAQNVGVISGLGAWIVALICMLVITVLSFIILLTVYGRFFKIFIYTALAPIPLAGFAGEPTSGMGRSFVRSYLAVLMEGAVILLACVIYSAFAASPPVIDPDASAQTMIFTYMGQLIFQMLILVATIRGADRIAREVTGL